MTDEEFKRSLQNLADVLQAALTANSRNLVWDVQAITQRWDIKFIFKATCSFDTNLMAYYNVDFALYDDPANTFKYATIHSRNAFESIIRDLSHKLFGNPLEGDYNDTLHL